MNYLKDESYYKDLYDRFTVEECRSMEVRSKESDKSFKTKEGKTVPKAEQKRMTIITDHLVMYILTGERYAQKEETIRQWMERDQERDDKLARATEPNVLCAKCNEEMECISKELRESDNQEQVLFFFTCPSCKSHRAFFDNGKEYKPQPQLCPHCQTELAVKDSRQGKTITSTYSCTECDYKKKEIFNFSIENKTEKPDPNFKKDRARFCLSEKDGGEYIQLRYKLEALKNMRKEMEERKKNKEIYDAVANIKKLTVQGLQKLLTPILNRNSYVKLNFSQPRIEKQVIIDFTVQDAKSDREEYNSEKQLEKIINKSLCDVNWKLMSNGISYRLGILSGSLKGFETEEDLVKLVKSRNKKNTK